MVQFTPLCKNIHPRIVFGQAEIDSLRARADHPDVRPHLDALRAQAEQLLAQPLYTEEYANEAKTQHGNFYALGAQITSFAETFGLLYTLGEHAYVPKMKQALLHYASFSAWTGPANKLRKTPWQSDLSTTRLTYGFALAYDIFYDALTDHERTVIREAMLHLGIEPLLADWTTDGLRVHAMDSMGHNWWAVCTAFAGIGLCAIYEDVPAWQETLAAVLRSLRDFCDYRGDPLLNKVANFDSLGMFYESAGYFNYGAGELCRFLHTYRRCFADAGESAFSVLPLLGDAFLSLTYPISGEEKTYYINFGDSAISSNSKTRDGMTLLPQYLLLLGLGNDQLRRHYTRTMRKKNMLDLLFPSLLGEDAPPKLPAESLYPETGLAMWRSGAEVDGTLFAIRCGFTWNHAHDDAGTFLLWRHGEAVLCDSGTVSYGKSDYISHYCAAAAHNVMTVNRRGQQGESLYRGNKFPGKLLHSLKQGSFTYLLADATGPMCDSCLRNHRSFLRLGEDIFVTVDELYTYAPAHFSYLLHHAGAATTVGEVTTIRTEKNTLQLHTVTPMPHTIRHDTYEGLAYLAVESAEPSRLCNMIHVIAPEERSIRVSPLTGQDCYGVRISTDREHYDLYYNFLADGRCMHINSNNRLGDFDTDAYLLCHHVSADQHSDVLMVWGSYLRRDGASLFERFVKETRVVEL